MTGLEAALQPEAEEKEPAPNMKFCRRCGAEIPKNIRVCWNCGLILDRKLRKLAKKVKK